MVGYAARHAYSPGTGAAPRTGFVTGAAGQTGPPLAEYALRLSMLYELLLQSARKDPDKTAIIHGDLRIDYGRLLGSVNGFAAELAGAGVGISDCVAVVLGNGPMFVVALFAAAVRRAIVLPLSPQLADEALGQYFADTRPRLVVTSPAHAERCRALVRAHGLDARVHVAAETELPEGHGGREDVRTAPEPHRGRALYLYTSGSEGYKKRICRTQENLYYESINFVRSAALGPDDTVTCLVPLYHSYGLGNGLLAAVGAGATLVLVHARVQEVPGGEPVELPFAARCEEILSLIDHEGTRVLAGVAHQYDALAALPRERDRGALPALSSLRWCLSSGNRLPLDVYQRFFDRFGVRIRQLYGSTETGSIAANLVTGSGFRPDVVGACLDNVEVAIVDENDRPLPVGEVGAVLVSSPVLAPDGYDGNAEATGAAFANGYYRTGDLGCLDADGVLRIVGRKQTFIDTGGYKVDPKKVEAVLLEHPAVREVAVLGVHAAGLGQVVKAVVVAGHGCDQESLAAYCRGRLAAYEVPQIIELRDELPRSPLGKIVKEELIGAGARGSGARRDGAMARCFVLDLDGSRSLDRMIWRQSQARAPGRGEVRIEVLAAGLNFLDLLMALGVIPDDTPGADAAAPRLGGECCGRIDAVGEGVESLRVGDEVIAIFPGCFASHVCVPAALVVPKPASLTVEEAAALPVAHATAHHALVNVARLAPGERLLVHAATGGVGLAALQVARRCQAEIFATAGSEAKRALLRELGVTAVMDSRSLSFAGEIRARTAGEGIDVVLNALAGAFIPTSLELLREGGRFIELGKRDYYADQQLGLRPFLRGLSFSLVDLRGLSFSRPALVQTVLREVVRLAEQGAYRPHIDRTVPGSEVLEAFHAMASAAHVGKIVIDLRDNEIEVRAAGAQDDGRAAKLRAALASRTRAEQRVLLASEIRDEVAVALHCEPAALSWREPLRSLGLDSLTTIVLQNRLGALGGVSLPVTFVWEHPSIEELAEGLLREMRVAASDAAGDELASAAEPVRPAGLGLAIGARGNAPGDEPIAVVGIGCRLPGGASSPAAYWQLLWAGTDAIREVPAERWRPEDVHARAGDVSGLVASRWGGFLDQIDGFDAAFFGITANEAQSMDPQQRLLLEVAWEALEDGGLPPDSLRGSRTGVFVGMSFYDYGVRALYPHDLGRINPYSGTGNAFSIAAGRISYVLGLTGPSIAVDTACSSSLAAVHLACQSLRTGECDMAMAGGVNLIIEPHAGVSLGRMEALASDGRCKPFDAAADGIVRSEGCGVVVLKPLGAALRDHDRVYALIRGSASNQDGRSNGLTAPNGRAQRELIRLALARACVVPSEVGFVETHGTGTRLGDPIEVHALGDVLGAGRDPARPVIIGAAKSNIGHTEACAGIAGLIKAALVVQQGAIPANLHFRQPSPHIDWKRLPVMVAAEPTRWPSSPGARRIAGVSSFGFSGTNVHVILEEPPDASGLGRGLPP
jgi:acyl-CoA synthetase (AMP-forming)/AMP-acid ligase II/NADPH:quinone reductase-like Zn-dependent oxidoreductase/3-oxoacyl-(acyl-carrier-protein) synthase